MMSFAPYAHKPNRLEDFLPWGLLVAKGVILNKDGSFQTTARFRGPDVRSSTPEELVSFAARANNVFRRLGSGWAIFIEAERQPITAYPEGAFEDDLSRLIDCERAEAFEAEGARFETLHHLTLQWRPPPEAHTRASAFLFEREDETVNASLRRRSADASALSAARIAHEALEAFQRAASHALGLFEGLVVDFQRLSDDETLSYLKRAVSPGKAAVRAPAAAAFLDGLLCEAPLIGGARPMLGDTHLRVLTIKGFPPFSSPGLLDDLNALAIPFRWMTRYLCLDREEAIKELTKWRRLWFSKHKSLAALLKEVMMRETATFSNPDALAKTEEVDAALEEVGAETVGFGYLTSTLVVTGTSAEDADERLRLIDRAVSMRGFSSVAESLNSVEAWLSSLPGHAWANVRKPMVSTLNLAHIAPLSTPWAGERWNQHLDAPPLAMVRTEGSTPFRLDLHVGDVGHTLIVGPTGAGKSVLLAFLALQWKRYAGARVFIFDKGGSARAALLGLGGAAIDLGCAGVPAFQPLAHIDTAPGRTAAFEWLRTLLLQDDVPDTPEARETIWSALESLATAPIEQRHLTGLRLLVQDARLQSALLAYTEEGPYGALFDGAEDRLTLSTNVLFEMEEIMARPKAAAPALLYLFNRLEAEFDGRPALLILDEAWLFLDSPVFAARIREWLKTLRKKNVAVIFATQSLADISASSIAPALIESCPTRIYLPNERAFEPQQCEVYERFGLNATEIALLATARRKQDYYYASPKGRRLFDLALGPIALSVCAASDARSRQLVAQLETTPDASAFWRRFLRAKGLAWVLDAIDAPGERSGDPNDVSSDTRLEPIS
ncbi:MAG: conjugal transfer protein TrbE [Alphaproteobacteria bacterium]|nr:conjugal transfer protein TrbE [Alphaproteobacteria bacterium]